MNTSNYSSEDARLSSLLRESRLAPGLPPRFQESVWRRIEHSDPVATRVVEWVVTLTAKLINPRFALASIAMLLVAGLILGSLDGTAQARQTAQERYLAAVAMSVAP